MKTFSHYLMEKSQNLEALAARYHRKAQMLKGKVDRGDVHQNVAYHIAMSDYHNAMAKHDESTGNVEGAHEHQEAMLSHDEHVQVLTKHRADESVQVNERINTPQGHENIGDPISDDSKEGTGPKKKMMGQTSALVQTIAKILSKGK